MTFKSEFKAKLEGGAQYKELLAFVCGRKAEELGQREAYDELQELWLEYGFDDNGHEEANQLRDDLEYVMEVAWGFCAAAAGIWERSLSNKTARPDARRNANEPRRDS